MNSLHAPKMLSLLISISLGPWLPFASASADPAMIEIDPSPCASLLVSGDEILLHRDCLEGDEELSDAEAARGSLARLIVRLTASAGAGIHFGAIGLEGGVSLFNENLELGVSGEIDPLSYLWRALSGGTGAMDGALASASAYVRLRPIPFGVARAVKIEGRVYRLFSYAIERPDTTDNDALKTYRMGVNGRSVSLGYTLPKLPDGRVITAWGGIADLYGLPASACGRDRYEGTTHCREVDRSDVPRRRFVLRVSVDNAF